MTLAVNGGKKVKNLTVSTALNYQVTIVVLSGQIKKITVFRATEPYLNKIYGWNLDFSFMHFVGRKNAFQNV